jgi:signal transduction histidine kinase
LLGEYQESLRDGWARSCEPDASSSSADARDGFSSFLTELTAALRVAASGGAPPRPGQPDADESPATGLDPVVTTRALGLLHGRILEIAAERGVEVSLAEQLALVSQVNTAIGRAAAMQKRSHERDLHRLAHELRNPLGSAFMALKLLRARVDLGESARLAEMAERNLQKLQGLIDEAVDEGGPGPSPTGLHQR